MEVRFLIITVNVHKFRLCIFYVFFCIYPFIVYSMLGNDLRAPIDSRDAL